ncbi:butyrophilin-like protein 2 [Acipenser ruthenus]|uniref:butyrophilin-like protein 2 n=1 Tax=Acipenser ruthenus TaxID=7906 RepID=UPI00145B333D|nr:butyrophilin-like protein 2 [Acipenser ruthenus]
MARMETSDWKTKSLCLLSFLYIASAEMTLMELELNNSVIARYNESVLLHCKAVSKGNMTLLLFEWLRPPNTILYKFRKGHETQHSPRISWVKQGFEVSLTINQLKPSDEGNYTCKVRTGHGMKFKNVTVELEAPYSDSSPDCMIQVKELTCVFSGGYPKGEIHWFDEEGNNVTDRASNNCSETGEGLFNISSSYHIGNHSSHSYNCSLWIPRSAGYSATKQISSGWNSCAQASLYGASSKKGLTAALLVWGGLLCGILIFTAFTNKHKVRDWFLGPVCGKTHLRI